MTSKRTRQVGLFAWAWVLTFAARTQLPHTLAGDLVLTAVALSAAYPFVLTTSLSFGRYALMGILLLSGTILLHPAEISTTSQAVVVGSILTAAGLVALWQRTRQKTV